MAATILPFPHVPTSCMTFGEHAWEDDYYGVGCTKCDEWYPHGSAPWEDSDDDEEEEVDN